MELIKVNDSNKREFMKFYEDRYLNSPIKRNSMSSLLKGLIRGKSVMCKSVDLESLMVMDNGRIIMICILAHAHRMPEFLQIAFFEATENNMAAFKLILDRTTSLAKEKCATKICGSLNVHVNYGLGFLAGDYDKWQSFGSPHNPEFYNTLFEKNGFQTIDMVSFYKDINEMEPPVSLTLRDKLEKRYTVRKVNFKQLKKEAAIYTDVNNEAFKEHLFYYHRDKKEDLELFKDLRFLIRPENLLFVERNNLPVGFMLWYPDFHKLMSPKETVGVSTVIKNRLFHNRIKTFKIVEIGVIPSEQSRGAILALFDYLYKITKGRYDNFESGWILKENEKSLGLTLRYVDGVNKNYKAFIKDVE